MSRSDRNDTTPPPIEGATSASDSGKTDVRPHRSRPRKVLRWGVRIFLGLVALVVLAVGGVLIGIHTTPGRAFLKDQVNGILNDTFVGGASIGSIEGSPFGTLVARDIVINDPTGAPAVKVARADVKIGLAPLVGKRVELRSVVVRGVDVRLARAQDGALLVPTTKPKPQPEPESTWTIDIAHLEVHDGHVAFQAQQEKGDLQWINADDIAITGRAMIPAGAPISATIALQTVWRERGVPVQLHGQVRTGEGVVQVPTLHLMAGSVMITGESVRVAMREDGLLPRIAGTLTVVAPKQGVEALVPGIAMLDDVTAKIELADAAPWTHVGVVAALGPQSLSVYGAVDLDVQHAQGIAATGSVDLGRWTNDGVKGVVSAFVAFDGVMAGKDREKPMAYGVAHASGDVLNIPRSALFSTVVLEGEALAIRGNISNEAARGLISADVTLGDTILLKRGYLNASTSSPSLASGGRAPLKGAFKATIEANGRLSPLLDMNVKGKVDGQRLRMQDISARNVKVAFDMTNLPTKPRGKAEVEINSLVRGDMQLGELKVTAASQGDTFAVAVRSRPKLGPHLIELDARIAPPKPREQTWTIDLERHLVRMADKGEWKGTTGHLEIAPNRYAIHNFSSESVHGAVQLSASVAPRALEIQAAVQRPDVGNAKLEVDVVAPVAFTNPAAWARLDRSAIRNAELSVVADLGKAAELAGQGGKLAGNVTGKLVLNSETASGSFAFTGVRADPLRDFGEISAALNIAQDTVAANDTDKAHDQITTLLAGNLGALGGFQAVARFAIPANPFNPAAWAALGPQAMKGAQVALDEVTLEPGLLDRFGVTTELRGRVKFDAMIGEGMKSVQVTLGIAQLQGDGIAKPLDARVEAVIDDKLTTASALISSGRFTLVDGRVEIPLTMAQVVENPALLATAGLQGKILIPKAPAKDFLAVFGRTELTGGTLDGVIDIKGTIGKPSVVAKLTGDSLQMQPGPRGKPVKPLDKVVLDASYDGAAVKATLKGTQPGGLLDITAQVPLANLEAGVVTVKAKQFDLQPVLVFAPGPTGAMKGRLDADLTMTGLDPVSAKLKGTLKMVDARIPIAPQVGTLRQANLSVIVSERAIDVTADGKLGPGTVKLVGKIAVQGTVPTGGNATLTLRDVTPIGALEPKIDADVTAALRKETDRWVIDVGVMNGRVDVPKDRGEALKPIGAPTDIVYATTGKPLDERPLEKAPPKKAVIVANIKLGPTYVKSEEISGVVRGQLAISADADAIGITGAIEADRGDLDLFGRRYQVERAVVRFDGTTDPILDIRITHNFPEVTTVTSVRGRVSKPELVLSSDPPLYSQDQLLGFLIGGEPNGDPQQGSAKDVATSAGGSFIANQIGNRVKKFLPVDIDVIRYAAATATESANVTVGTWVSRSLFLAYRRRLEARPDENSNEANVQWYLTRRVMVEANSGDRAVSGIDLLWRKRY